MLESTRYGGGEKVNEIGMNHGSEMIRQGWSGTM